jgi:hypothetical protein
MRSWQKPRREIALAISEMDNRQAKPGVNEVMSAEIATQFQPIN